MLRPSERRPPSGAGTATEQIGRAGSPCPTAHHRAHGAAMIPAVLAAATGAGGLLAGLGVGRVAGLRAAGAVRARLRPGRHAVGTTWAPRSMTAEVTQIASQTHLLALNAAI